MHKKRCRNRGHGHDRTLRDYPCGSRIRIKDIAGCPKDRCRLLAMGLTPGTTAEVSANACGSCCLRVRNADIVLGDDLANTVTACPLAEDEGQVA
ncbi:FeoA family protein [Desulfovibrio ferrophilus]|uniref:Ferrous iron transport protein a n=1 Tax=Desulfovibrio ferrophilus TaxID=241368 RepID=A0A2Z6B3L1_9BACT|nr:FeoA family protein [Desulfovibrio ferrophilus]BBD10097.1 ferrous iron transport protein a [Desulfovibrio ferrophilus]